jgi:hypothetical protein
MGFHDVPVNQSILTDANRGLCSYIAPYINTEVLIYSI